MADHAPDAPTVVGYVERINLAGLGAHGFGRWLEHWKAERRNGWEIVALLAKDGTHAVAIVTKSEVTPGGGDAVMTPEEGAQTPRRPVV